MTTWKQIPRLTARPAATVLFIVGMTAASAHAQRTDDEWLERCREQRGERERHCLVRVETMRATGSLEIDAGRNGGVMVYGSDRGDVEVHARIQAWAESAGDAESIANDVELDVQAGSVSADGPSTRNRQGWSVIFIVHVPRQSDLDLRANNGPMSVEDVAGSIEARTRNGPLSLAGVAGDVRARTQNGPISIELYGDRWNGEGLDAETQNGPVTLTIPEDFNATLVTGTVHGPMNTDLPLRVEVMGQLRNRRIEATLGDGGPRIRAVTTNGPVTIRKRD